MLTLHDFNMSRKSDNSKAGSEGNGDSILSSYQNSPRKTPEFGSAGPFGDYCTENNAPSCYLFMMNNDSSDSDDQQGYDLKTEYLERLNVIRQKLANIDIANYGSYYPNCNGYPTNTLSRCQITEISDESPKDEDNIITNYENEIKTNICSKRDTCNFKEIYSTQDMQLKQESPLENAVLNKDIETDQNTTINNDSSCTKRLEQVFIHHSAGSNKSKDSNCSVNIGEEVQETNFEKVGKECKSNLNKKNCSEFELKTIFKYDDYYNLDNSSLELIDLNYNPPKKKYCVREQTPKLIMSEGAMSLPYHIRIGLHGDVLKAHDRDDPISSSIINVKNKCESITHHSVSLSADAKEGETDHIFPEVSVDCSGGGDQEHNDSRPFGRAEKQEKEVAGSLERPIRGRNDYIVAFFETLEQCPSESNLSHQTVVTETTVASDSPSRMPKRRRLLIRSARNKVSPIDKISLWEEIRTMEALSKIKQDDSSSSLESYFKDVVEYKTETEPNVDLISVESSEVPPTIKISSKFPSFTKISELYSMIFKRKPRLEKCLLKSESSRERFNFNRNTQKTVISATPKRAHMLLNVRKEQDLDIDLGEHSTLDETETEASQHDEEDDEYYDGFCPICFCF